MNASSPSKSLESSSSIFRDNMGQCNQLIKRSVKWNDKILSASDASGSLEIKIITQTKEIVETVEKSEKKQTKRLLQSSLEKNVSSLEIQPKP
jgi:hypothetical protein